MRKIRPRELLFALIPLLALLVGVTLLLDTLERAELIDTEVPDDTVAYLAGPAYKLEQADDDRAYYVIADRTLLPQRFATPKEPGVFRLFILGGSFALGSPYVVNEPTPGGIDSWVREELAARFPSLRIEVINSACGAQNSFRVKQIFHDVIEFEPDALLVVMGNNEGFIPPTSLHPLVHQWSLYRTMRALIRPPDYQGPKGRPQFSPQLANINDLLKVFAGNQLEMVRSAQDHDVPLVLATMPINLRYDPWPYRDDPDPWPDKPPPECFAKALDLFDRQQEQQGIEALYNCPCYAANYLLGQRLEKAGRYDEARLAYTQAVTYFPSNRTRPGFNWATRRNADQPGVILADFEAVAEDRAVNGIPGAEQFVDYCHMNWSGYQAMAHELVRTLISSGIIRGAAGEPLPEPGTEQLLRRLGTTPDDLELAGSPFLQKQHGGIAQTIRRAR
ncbi:MAG: hypothetical protein P9M14_11610 [Candidatus Alcyoniella australis]|nr:hypothetical protein [Candidatus Alcyoniella australis]